MNAGIERNYLGETVPVKLSGGGEVHATVAYSDNIDLERLLVVLPPNPTLGGDSENNVVQALLNEACARGVLAMTFDYRGVATGRVGDTDLMTYWEGLEQNGDFGILVEDAGAAVQAVRQEFEAGNCCGVVGYSFGAYLALRTAQKLGTQRVGGVSPPVLEYDFSPWLTGLDVHFFAAPDDIFCPAAQADAMFVECDVSIKTVPSDDHFFRGVESRLAGQVLEAVGISG